ncbi:MAG: DUF3794 domain-containing protein [Tepidibacter sp.]|jgi:dimeric dUTPase (all-alpha-NTP-PPase superfamily)|uniref:SPOCS domain-containing protein n=1 Tax=Tepidibacter sp. TaxID=2529387 RepID=UPI0025EE796B|nr:SPOCS domain-containing protein [Tepidibacter sp.]MCT4508393.1 DUF3794 domain-containing protein [Tepidibacter sp.]
MNSIVENLISVSGISDNLPKNTSIFKQFCIEQNLVLSENKPEIHQIISVILDISITNKKLIDTPIKTSIEGQNLTGKGLIVEGKIKQKIEYASDTPTKIVHGTYFNTPFSTFIILSNDYKIDNSLIVTGYIEDNYLSLLDKKTIFENITVLIDVTRE